jgi:hypothetical protein
MQQDNDPAGLHAKALELWTTAGNLGDSSAAEDVNLGESVSFGVH